ncbi:alpha/beta hydrolase [Glutamicibacter sp. MNS18]|uniref:alpha/beta hydrolase n=1 Tax=Glutamicibacter sp. MNS18 TaxID=2989817 RepID=UPI002235670D|nr:alpha/beta hydrolase [Glutamicibacter sp. MNS18]MCW4466851.1 alpha/beta hydrolase [Glutamicibacter sp. MNS18]
MSVRPSHHRWLPTAAITAVLGLVLSGCSTPTPQAPTEPSQLGSGLETYYEQELTWDSCGSIIECATVQVPLDYSEPEGESIELALNRRSAQDSEKNLLVNPGGPGGSGLDLVTSSVPLMFSNELQREYSIIGFDPRGVGRSTPISCLSDGQRDAAREKNLRSWVKEDRDEIREESKKYAQACQENSGDLLGHVDTVSAAKDMDIIRAALGDGELNYLGYSYGTFLGATYANLFPASTGRFVLDGALDPKSGATQVDQAQAVGFEGEITAWLEDCLGTESCPFTGSVDEARGQLHDFLESVEEQPLESSDGRTVPIIDFINGFIVPLYDNSTWPMLSTAMADAMEGDVDMILMFADLTANRQSDGSYSSNSSEVFGAINCLDRPMDAAEARMEAEAQELQRVAPTLGKYLSYGALGCEYWPYDATGRPGELNATGAGDILVIGTTGDPATPYQWAESLARQLDGGMLLTYEGHGHTAYGRSNDCITQAVDGYLIDGELPQEGTRC